MATEIIQETRENGAPLPGVDPKATEIIQGTREDGAPQVPGLPWKGERTRRSEVSTWDGDTLNETGLGRPAVGAASEAAVQGAGGALQPGRAATARCRAAEEVARPATGAGSLQNWQI